MSDQLETSCYVLTRLVYYGRVLPVGFVPFNRGLSVIVDAVLLLRSIYGLLSLLRSPIRFRVNVMTCVSILVELMEAGNLLRRGIVGCLETVDCQMGWVMVQGVLSVVLVLFVVSRRELVLSLGVLGGDS